MVPPWRHSEEPFSVPDGTFVVLCVAVRVNVALVKAGLAWCGKPKGSCDSSRLRVLADGLTRESLWSTAQRKASLPVLLSIRRVVRGGRMTVKPEAHSQHERLQWNVRRAKLFLDHLHLKSHMFNPSMRQNESRWSRHLIPDVSRVKTNRMSTPAS